MAKEKENKIIKLGQHRLICGDCKDPDIIKKLVGQDKIRIILTDPPYGVAYVESKASFFKDVVKAPMSCGEKKIANDQLQTDEEYIEFTIEWMEPIKNYLSSYNAFYIFNGDLMVCAVREAIKKIRFHYNSILIWVKSQVFPGRRDYLAQHELIVYGWYGRHKFEKRNKKSVMFCPKPRISKLHPTMKPIRLLRKLILNSTKAGEYVYDPFGGSGSTLIACEQTKRRCLMIEIDERYCEVIKKRYKRYMEGIDEKTAEYNEIKKK